MKLTKFSFALTTEYGFYTHGSLFCAVSVRQYHPRHSETRMVHRMYDETHQVSIAQNVVSTLVVPCLYSNNRM